MRILFICHRFPFPPIRGGKIRPFQIIHHLSKSHSVTVASLAHSREEMEAGAGLKDHCAGIIAEVLPNSVRWPQTVLGLATGVPSSVEYFRSNRLRARIEDAWHAKPFDAVMVHCAFVAQYALALSGGLRILDFGDLDSAKWLDYSQHRAFPLSLGYALEARKLRRYERKIAGTFDRITVTTSGESDQFLSLGVARPCTVVPNGVDAQFFQPSVSAPDKPIIVFLGRMDYFPNIDGILWFVREVFPLIRTQEPQAELRVVGANPTREVQRLAGISGVTVTGFVKDVRPYLEGASVAIAPLRIARGTQNKILECMAAGLPVVSTTQAAKGIQAIPGEHLLVADASAPFSEKVLALLRDACLRAQLASAARRQIERAHSWPDSMHILDGVIEDGWRAYFAAKEAART